MSKSLTFRVEIDFSENVNPNDEDLMEISQNIANAIKHEANHGAIAPDGADYYTEIIRVTPQYLNKAVIEHVI